jgi:hypothetical protein
MDLRSLKMDLERVAGMRAMDTTEVMADVLKRLDAYARELQTPERLKHYLSRRSYVKALEWIEDPSLSHRQ